MSEKVPPLSWPGMTPRYSEREKAKMPRTGRIVAFSLSAVSYDSLDTGYNIGRRSRWGGVLDVLPGACLKVGSGHVSHKAGKGRIT